MAQTVLTVFLLCMSHPGQRWILSGHVAQKVSPGAILANYNVTIKVTLQRIDRRFALLGEWLEPVRCRGIVEISVDAVAPDWEYKNLEGCREKSGGLARLRVLPHPSEPYHLPVRVSEYAVFLAHA